MPPDPKGAYRIAIPVFSRNIPRYTQEIFLRPSYHKITVTVIGKITVLPAVIIHIERRHAIWNDKRIYTRLRHINVVAAVTVSCQCSLSCPGRRNGERQKQSQQGNYMKRVFHAKPTFFVATGVAICIQ